MTNTNISITHHSTKSSLRQHHHTTHTFMSMRCKLLRKKELSVYFPFKPITENYSMDYWLNNEACFTSMWNVDCYSCSMLSRLNVPMLLKSTLTRRELKILRKVKIFLFIKAFSPLFLSLIGIEESFHHTMKWERNSVNKIKWFSILFRERLWKLWKQFKSWIYPWDVLLILYANAFKLFLWSIINCPTNKSSLLIQFNFSPRAHAYCCLIMAS